MINPLQVADRSPENIDLMAQLFVSAFNEIMDNSQLTLNMKVLLHSCVSVFGDASLPDLQLMLDDDRNAGILRRAQACRAFRKYRDFFGYEFLQSDYHPTKRAICKKIQSLLNYRAFYNLTVGASTVDLRALMDSRQLVVFNLSKGKLGLEAMPASGKFLVAMLQGLALRREALPEHLAGRLRESVKAGVDQHPLKPIKRGPATAAYPSTSPAGRLACPPADPAPSRQSPKSLINPWSQTRQTSSTDC